MELLEGLDKRICPFRLEEAVSRTLIGGRWPNTARMRLSASSLSTVMIYQRLASGSRRDLHPNLGQLNLVTLQETMSVVARLGFSSFELYLDTEANLSMLLQDDNARLLLSAGRDLGLNVDRAYLEFLPKGIFRADSSEEGVWDKIGRLSALLGIEVVEMVSPPLPPERVSEASRSDSSWSWIWEKFVSSMSSFASQASKRGVKLALEPRPREILSGTDSLLRLLDRVPSDALGGVVDISHLQIVREVPGVSIRKLGSKVFSVHLSDNDGVTEWHWAPGQGQIDWKAVLDALRAVNYSGPLSLDVSGIDVRHELADGRRYIESVMEGYPFQVSKSAAEKT